MTPPHDLPDVTTGDLLRIIGDKELTILRQAARIEELTRAADQAPAVDPPTPPPAE